MRHIAPARHYSLCGESGQYGTDCWTADPMASPSRWAMLLRFRRSPRWVG